MKIMIAGKNKKISRKETKNLIKFYLDLLMKKSEYKKINITVTFSKINNDFLGYLQSEDSKNFYIHIDSNMSKKKQMKIIAHELVHVKQYIRDELESYSPITDENYWDHPAEVEAFGRSVGMYAKYVGTHVP